jgi:hypothetical protein
MREPHNKPLLEFGEPQEVVKLSHLLQGQPIVDELDLGWIHMYTLLLHDVSQILDSLHVEGTLIQIGI